MINLKEFQGQSVVTPWDRLKKYIFNSYPIVRVDKRATRDDTLLTLANEHRDESEMVWIVNESANIREDFPWHYRPSGDGRHYIHKFPTVTKRTKSTLLHGDIYLVPTGSLYLGSYKNRIIASYQKTDFDVFMISYHEAEADANFMKLKQKFPDAKHVKNVEGIANAHKECARQSETEMVYIVDADADIVEDFYFNYLPPMSKRKNTTYVWSARNPINGLEYGYGAVKLFPRQQLLDMGHELPDFTTGVAFYQPISDVSNYTRFNRDPYRTWRSAFRECVKLASSVNPNQKQAETDARLETWTTVDNGERFGRYCIKGALEGKAYGEENKGDVEALNKINDFDWLREQFVASMKKRITEN